MILKKKFMKVISFKLFFWGMIFFFLSSKKILYFPLFISYFDCMSIFDWVSLLFLSILFFMTGSVFFFSINYIGKKIFFFRFIWLMICFVLSMIFIMMFPESLFLLIGWDGLGMFSFLLVCFYKAKSSWKASLKTYLTKRMGDSFFIMLFASLVKFSFWKIEMKLKLFMTLYFVLACFTKSAQIPFSSWLPAAMAAPTPVSALVHSSTLVTAGIYLMFRKNLDFYSNYFVIMGLLTAFFAAFSAAKEYDSKKMVALSTLSKLGMMVFALSLKFMKISFFHLLTHAVAKANLFMSVGWLMLTKNHHQDIRFLKSKFWKNFFMKMNLSFTMWSLSGMLFFSGFFSKEKIIESFKLYWNNMYFLLFFFMMFFSLIYGFRLYQVLSKKFFFSKKLNLNSSKYSFSIIFLFFFTIFLSMLLKKNFFSKFCFKMWFLKIMIYSFIMFSLFYMSFFKFYQLWFMKDLMYIQYMGSSLFFPISKNKSLMFYFFDKKINFKLKNFSFIKLFNFFLKKMKVSKFFFWMSIFFLVFLF